MQITKAMLDQRAGALQNDLKNLESTMMAIKGAIQDVMFWQARLEQEDKTEEKKTKVGEELVE